MQATILPAADGSKVRIIFEVDTATWQTHRPASQDPASLINTLAAIWNLPQASGELAAAVAQVQAHEAHLAKVKAMVGDLVALLKAGQ